MPRRSLSQYKDVSQYPALSRNAEIAYAQKAAAPKTAVHQARRVAALTPRDWRTAQTPAPSFLDSLKAKYPLLATFASTALFQWITEYLLHRLGSKHAFNTYDGSDQGVYELTDKAGQPGSGPIRISIAGDWGTGTDEAAQVSALMQRSHPHYTIHLGDVYYVGDAEEVDEHCLGKRNPGNGFDPTTWYPGTVGSFALNGNHEMYALGKGYFDVFLPTLGIRPSPGRDPAGQRASFFALKNKAWIIIGLDTGYHSTGIPVLENIFQPDCHLPDELMAWLRTTVKPQLAGLGIIVLSHHQYYSAFESWITKPAQQLKEIIDRPVLWLWGHEHRFAMYDVHSFDNGIEAFGRCVGHGGMPVALVDGIAHEDCPYTVYDHRRYVDADEPGSLVVGYNGYVNVTLNQSAATLQYRDVAGKVVVEELWATDGGVLKLLKQEVMKDPDVLHRI